MLLALAEHQTPCNAVNAASIALHRLQIVDNPSSFVPWEYRRNDLPLDQGLWQGTKVSRVS